MLGTRFQVHVGWKFYLFFFWGGFNNAKATCEPDMVNSDCWGLDEWQQLQLCRGNLTQELRMWGGIWKSEYQGFLRNIIQIICYMLDYYVCFYVAYMVIILGYIMCQWLFGKYLLWQGKWWNTSELYDKWVDGMGHLVVRQTHVNPGCPMEEGSPKIVWCFKLPT